VMYTCMIVTIKIRMIFHCRELLLDFYSSSRNRKPTQIILFRCHSTTCYVC